MIRRRRSRRRRSRGADPEVAGWQLSRNRMLWLTSSLVLVLAPHATRLLRFEG